MLVAGYKFSETLALLICMNPVGRQLVFDDDSPSSASYYYMCAMTPTSLCTCLAMTIDWLITEQLSCRCLQPRREYTRTQPVHP
eukprot:2534078-Pleurochrysis_carterae.AAC.1